MPFGSTMKTCGRELPESEFYVCGGYSRSACKRCTCFVQRARKHGMTLEGLTDLFAKQGFCCAVCGRAKGLHKLVIDHNHRCCPYKKNGGSCGRCVRGLLCAECNQGIGLLGEDPGRLQGAIKYLQMGS